MNDVTRILNAASQSDALAANELLSLLYEELRRLAAAKMALEAPGQTLQATALVHEAWLRLTNDEKRKWNDRIHFFAAAARVTSPAQKLVHRKPGLSDDRLQKVPDGSFPG